MTARKKSEALFERACKVMPGGVNSPVRAFFGLEMTPLVVQRGLGDRIWDEDERSYIDFCSSWGSLILGHVHAEVAKAAISQISLGSSFGITTAIEERFATQITTHLPSIEKLRFVSSGTEATMSALRLARGYTGKDLIVKFDGNYHGHADHLLIGAGSGVSYLPPGSAGVPVEMVRFTRSLRYNDLYSVRKFLSENCNVAAVILEPIAANMGLVPATIEFLQMLREETRKSGALLIFDEVVTGFRVGLGGVQEASGIQPDLTCLAKIIGGGFPAAAFGGRREIMDRLAPLGDVYQAGTLSGNPVAMAAGLAVLNELEKPGFYQELERKTRLLTDPIAELIRKKNINVYLAQRGSMFSLFFGVKSVSSKEDLKTLDHAQFRRFFSFLFERGIYLSPSAYETCFVSSAHTEEHLLYTQQQICDFLGKL
ncbi:MAG: glutamate-1-semialdehyde 2,1-aminomutase [Chlamydiales bacterium]|nr:glutamate-1-semialdehyde 2,1-aminomutase [Chlamydiales bacterium]